MPNQTNIRYLVCTRNRGFQRKHIDVCKRCTSNNECREYQECLRMEPVAAEPISPTQKPVAVSMGDLIEELAEIRQLAGNGTSGYRLHLQLDAPYRPDASLNRFLIAELKAIKSICQSSPVKPAPLLIDSGIQPTSH